MAFGLPFFNKNRSQKENLLEKVDSKEVLLGLDVGTRYIKAIIYQLDDDGAGIRIIGYSRVAQRYGAMRDAMIVNLQNVISACDLAVGKALDAAEKRLGQLKIPEKVTIGIAGELVKGVSIIANYEREKSEDKISQEELDLVVEQVKEEAFAGAIEEIAKETGISSDQIEEISSRIDTTEVDGVVVNNPLGFTGKNVVYRVYATFAPKLHLNSLQELANQLGLEEVSIVVQPYAVSRATKDVHDQSPGAIIIDMGGGTTDVALVSSGSVLGTKMFAFGGDVITRRIAELLKLEIPQAEETKLEYTDGNLTENIKREIKSIINQDLKIWVEGVQIALEELLDDEDGELKQLPSRIYLCGGGVALPEIREVLLSHPWLTVLPFAKFPKIEFLYPNQLVGVKDETRLLIEPGDVTPASVARMIIDSSN